MDDMPVTLSHELVEREDGEVQGLGETALPPVPPAIGNALYSRGIHVTDLPISPERVLDGVDARDGRGEAWANAASELAAASGQSGDLGETNYPSGSTREPTPPMNGVRSLLTSPSAVLLLGTLAIGLLATALYRLLHRRVEARK
jgi:hypothetical protein